MKSEKVPGHTKFICQWLLKPHFYVVRGEGRCLGGAPVTDAQKTAALRHMKTWTMMTRETLLAEFPAFGLLRALSAFQLPKKVGQEEEEEEEDGCG